MLLFIEMLLFSKPIYFDVLLNDGWMTILCLTSISMSEKYQNLA